MGAGAEAAAGPAGARRSINAGTAPAIATAATATHPYRNVVSGLALVPAPSMATIIATPTAKPTWRTMLMTAAPVANRGGGRETDAVAIVVGRVRPTPTPV